MASGGPNGRTFSAGGKDSSSGASGLGKSNASFGQTSTSFSCCHHHPPTANPVRITAKVLFGSVSAISSLNAERCRKRAQ